MLNLTQRYVNSHLPFCCVYVHPFHLQPKMIYTKDEMMYGGRSNLSCLFYLPQAFKFWFSQVIVTFTSTMK